MTGLDLVLTISGVLFLIALFIAITKSDNKQINKRTIEKINEWQNAGFVHPLTCGKDSTHQNLIPREKNGRVILCCPDCDYVQERIPPEVLSDYVQRFKDQAYKRSILE
ncbi:MAG: hypothetical protein Q8Q06_04210 [bacterium]|nr:hypothetical protein [bacterium]